MLITRTSFRKGFYAGALVAVAVGVYLLQLWQSDRQLELHSQHFIEAVAEKDWSEIEGFIDTGYSDQWGHDRAVLLARMRAVLQYTRTLQLEAHEPLPLPNGEQGEWRARITVDGDESEVTALIKQHINGLQEPFRLQWRRKSWKPWDWKLAGVTNSALELPEGAGL